MNLLVKQLTESSTIWTPKPVIVDSRPQEFWRCPHCQQEIHEKHTALREGVEIHLDCGGAIVLPPFDWSKVSPEWRKLLGGPSSP